MSFQDHVFAQESRRKHRRAGSSGDPPTVLIDFDEWLDVSRYPDAVTVHIGHVTPTSLEIVQHLDRLSEAPISLRTATSHLVRDLGDLLAAKSLNYIEVIG